MREERPPPVKWRVVAAACDLRSGGLERVLALHAELGKHTSERGVLSAGMSRWPGD